MLPFSLFAQKRNDFGPEAQLSRKLAPALLHENGRGSTSGSYRVQVTDETSFTKWLKDQKLQVQLKKVTGHAQLLLISGLKTQQLKQLAACPLVRYIDQPNRVAREELELKDADFVANNILAVHGRFPQLNGDGMKVSVKEEAFNPADIDLKGRVLSPETFSNVTSVHATTMATLIAGAGNSGPAGKGIARKAQLAYSSFAELMPDKSQELLGKGISVQNHSYGVGVENYYGLESQAYDQETSQYPQLLHVFSSGNSGDKPGAAGPYEDIAGMANLTGQFKNSKNTLSVGALEPDRQVGIRSSKGPAYDGRVKPELVAHGKGGTSEAAAVVSGVALLVQQAYQDKYGSSPQAALIKAALINSADDVGRPQVDFESGFGDADALGAIRSIQENRFFEATISTNETRTFTIAVPQGARLLKATLVWHDPEAEPGASKALINDLDLTLTRTSTSQHWQPWVLSSFPHPDSLMLPARRGTDRLNNVEQITLSAPVAGTYQLTVRGHQVATGPQSFSMVYEYESGAEWLYPTAGASVMAGQLNRIRWQGGAEGETARLEYRLAGTQEWQLIEEVADPSSTFYHWQAPDHIALAQLRITTGDVVTESEEFILAKQLNLKVGFDCEEETLLHWSALPNVQQYQLYKLGYTHLEPFLTVSDTLVVLNRNISADLGEIVAVAPVVQGREAYTSLSIPYANTGTGCYIKSFLPQSFVMDTVKLDLQISTLYQLSSLSLERFENGTYRNVKTIQPVTQLAHLLQDPAPRSGKNVYRVKVTTVAGKAFYSQDEEVLYTKEGEARVYPNPVAAGQPVFVAVSSDTAELQLYDQLGRLMYETSEMGVIKEIPTAGLAKGLYFLRLKTESGSMISTRILVQ
ncbi:S8 family serine peptidase [Pontibacter ruber]|uniref:S8 family serine peptidase n=1 Tax=Pontibacter ruber TaxID=1343895 RepID=A0ABW5D263_9BACT|nr:S8 family serine peptidase [Pontibacter ruber]